MHEFHVPGMTCGGCLRAVTRAIQALDPKAQIEGDLENRRIKVTSEKEMSSILAALSNGGYPAEVLPLQNA